MVVIGLAADVGRVSALKRIFTNSAVLFTLFMIAMFVGTMLFLGYINRQRQDAVESYKASCEFIVNYAGRDAYYKCPSD